MNNRKIIVTLLLLMLMINIQAKIKVSSFFSDNMIVQRDMPIPVRGCADPGELIEVTFKTQTVKVKTDEDGNWNVNLSKSAYGGPYQMVIKGKEETLEFNNILVGDIWLCSGQSNMEWRVRYSNNSEFELSNATYPKIRFFTVEHALSSFPENEVKGSWQACSPETVGDFSAVGYFFGRELHKELDIPVGLINSSWGGTGIETWTSPEMMKTIPKFAKELEKSESMDVKKLLADNAQNKQYFQEAVKNDIGIIEHWYSRPSICTKPIIVPQRWRETELSDMDGCVWLSYHIDLPLGVENEEAVLSLGVIDDEDITFINGEEVGRTKGYDAFRKYKIAKGVLVSGENTVMVSVIDNGGDGGLYGAAKDIHLKIADKIYPMNGEWKYAVSVDSKEYGFVDIDKNSYPSLLYNGMIAPITQYPIKGVIWYQGEHNTSEAKLYQTLFPNLINNWREKWGYEFPFYWAQLANFMDPDEDPKESDWANLREAQSMTLSLPKTGQAIITDIGDQKDIHPRNKQDVGRRLALIALNKDYGKKDLVYSGPTLRMIETLGNKVVISFDNVGSGLVAKGESLGGFAISGGNNKFLWANAYIEGDKVIVSHDQVSDPSEIRYAWGNNPVNANLFNNEGLPALSFRVQLKK